MSGSTDKTIKVWDDTGTCVMTLQEHTDYVEALIVWEGLLVSGSWDQSVKLWNAKGECVRTLEGHAGPSPDRGVRCLTVHEGKLVSGGNDTLVRVWGYIS